MERLRTAVQRGICSILRASRMRHPSCSWTRLGHVPAKDRVPKALSVTVVSSNRETLDGLEAYLRESGVVANGTRALERLLEMTPPSAVAVILFPDEYGAAAVTKALAALHRGRPKVLAVLVTNEPGRFERATGVEPGDGAPLVIPKPAWAWTILDAVRARLRSTTLAE